MKAILIILLITAWSASISTVNARNFTLKKEIRGNDFFTDFYWWDYTDPTHGFVDYVSKSTAQASNLSYVNDRGNFVMQVDNTSIIPADSQTGRRSVRIHSKDNMDDGILIAKINWMPQGCGTWPAFWTCTVRNWPTGGEIDIIEGANDQGPRNLASLHTDPGCTIPSGSGLIRNDTGYSGQSNCQNQPGCSVGFSSANSFGPDFNQNGGGYFAMVRDTAVGGQGISVYFWSASNNSITLPDALLEPALPYMVTNTINVTSLSYSTKDPLWLTPSAHFPNSNSSCAMNSLYSDHNIIFNTDICGSWAGNAFQYASACPNTTCEEYVSSNPSAFSDARWEIEYLRVYATDGAFKLLSPAFFASASALLSLFLLIGI